MASAGADGINRSFCLAGHYQRNILSDDYEITLIENGSTRMLPERARPGPALRIPLSEYENIRVGALKARPSSKHQEESDQKSH